MINFRTNILACCVFAGLTLHANAQLVCYFAHGTTRVTTQTTTSPGIIYSFDIVVENQGIGQAIINTGTLMIAYATSTSEGPLAIMTPGSDKIALAGASPSSSFFVPGPYFYLVSTSLGGGRGAAGPLRPYGLCAIIWAVPPPTGRVMLQSGERRTIGTIALKNISLSAPGATHDVYLYDAGYGGSYTTAFFNYPDPPQRDSNWAINSKLTFVVPAGNHPPVANAGADQHITIPHDGIPGPNSATFTLDGSLSSDADSNPITYEWKEGATTIGTSAVLNMPARAPGLYTFTLTVTDHPALATNTDSVDVQIDPEPNTPPISNPGSNQIVTVLHDGNPSTKNANFTLNGSSSSDPDGDSLTFEWKLGTTVVGTSANLNQSLPAGNYTFSLKVTDPYGASDTKSVTVKVNPEPNSRPVAVLNTATVRRGPTHFVDVPLMANDFDPDGDPIFFVSANAKPPFIQSVTHLGNGIVRIRPSNLGSGTMTFNIIYYIRDSYFLNSLQGTITVTITP